MDKIEILKMFCSRDICRPVLNNPFNYNGHTYGTNGQVAVRFPLIEGYEVEDPPKIDKVWNRFEVKESDYKPVPIARDVVDFETCEQCRGKGHDYTCPDCFGALQISFESNTGVDYTVDCVLCKETGVINGECDACYGIGSTPEKRGMMVGKKLLGCMYIDILNRLPNAMIATDITDGVEPVPFKFDGGDGIIMPMRILKDGD